jgi:hypothetical protein
VELAELVERLAARKGVTEADIQSDVRALLLYGGLDLEEKDLIVLEAQVGGGRRIDVELGSTAIEIKKDLSNSEVHAKAVEQLAGYLEARTDETGLRYAGILTDGVLWELYYLAGQGPELVNSLRLRRKEKDTPSLAVWLEGVLATAQGISPTPAEIRRRLGADSSSFALDYADLYAIYQENKEVNDVALKRELWARLLASALGTHFQDTDELFVLHTYLVVSAELIAHTTVGLPVVGQPPRDLLSGEVFRLHELGGVVEPDFFDWPADLEAGQRFVRSLARRVARFDWTNVDHDVLKALYESVIDAETRKQLGEYYTPDWLAEGMVAQTVSDPLNQRVLDPACGSGTFLFWAVRRYLAAAAVAGRSNDDAITGVIGHVAGIDLHPVAVALARVTYLLAIGTERLKGEHPPFSVPVYLGDSLRWEQDETLLGKGGITIYTTDGAELFDRELYFPERIVSDAGRFDQLIADLAARASNRKPGAAVPSIDAVFKRLAIHPDDQAPIQAAFKALCDLHDEGRDHIWGYYIRNLARPLWFTQDQNRVDILVGNPPWLAYRFMSESMQELFRKFSERRGLWVGGKVATHQDLSDLFVVRSVEQYLRGGGAFGFVMPAAVLSRRQYAGFRSGYYPGVEATTIVEFTEPWDMRAVTPDPFPVPCAVVLGERGGEPKHLPETVLAYEGKITPRGTRWSDAKANLSADTQQVERGSDEGVVSPYAERFYQGATIVPSVLLRIRRLPAGPLGTPTGTRRVASLRSNLEKAPWKMLDDLEGLIEEQFLRRCYLGSSIAPFRSLKPIEVVVPWNNGRLLDGHDAQLDEYPHLATWWRRAEDLWERNKGPKNRLSLRERLDYHGEMTSQFPIQPHRLLYSASGNRITACRLDDASAILEHKLYWASMASREEAQYLAAILNSETVLKKVEPLMSEGLFGKRDIDKYLFAVPFPLFDPEEELHGALVVAGANAEAIVAELDLAQVGFSKARQIAREALAEDGVAEHIEDLVGELIAPVEVAL